MTLNDTGSEENMGLNPEPAKQGDGSEDRTVCRFDDGGMETALQYKRGHGGGHTNGRNFDLRS